MTTGDKKNIVKNKMMKQKNNGMRSQKPRIFIFLILIAFLLGIFIQDAFDFKKRISYLILPKENIQRKALKKIFDIQGTLTWSGFIVQKETDYPTYKQQLLQFYNKENNEKLGAYLLVPKTAFSSRLPAALCIHGHHSTKETVAGVESSPYNATYGHTLVEKNYIVLVPDIRYSQDIKGIEDMMSLNLIMYGKSLTGERLKDLLRCLAFLQDHKQVDPDRIGVVGWSMGGGLALYLAAIDEEIKLAYISNYFGTYEQTVMAMRQSTDNYIPGIKEFGELYDVAALIAPRPLLLEHSARDREFPAEVVKMAFDIVRNKYVKMGKADNIKLVTREGGHRFYGDQLIPWFDTFFKSQ